MKQSLTWRVIVVLAVVGLAAFSAHPLDEKIKLGLDLRGGIHLVLEVQTEDALRSETDKGIERLTQELRAGGADAVSATASSSTSFEVTGVARDQDSLVRQTIEDYLPGWDWNRSGEQLSFRMTLANENEIRELSVEQALQTIRNRIDAFGVTEPLIQRQGIGGDRLVVQLPGVDDPERVKGLIKNTAFLEFRLVEYPPGGNASPTREAILANYGGQLPANVEIMTGDQRDDQDRLLGQEYYAVERTSVITGRDLKDARPSLGQFNQPVVNFTLTHEGGQRFGEATGANIGRGLAIVLDKNVVSAPRINDRITDSGIIEGNFTVQEVQDLAMVLRSGALPAGITYLEERAVGPTLGKDSIEKGLRAGLIGGSLVILTMLVVYRRTGINAVLALVFNVIIIFGALAYFGATLTLPGIAGMVLIIGMAVDANVLVFERIREELRRGRTVRSSIDAGFSKALSSILDANITTLIAALFLFQFGTGPIRGFAVTLSIGILASVFTAIFVSRLIFDLALSRKQRVERLSI